MNEASKKIVFLPQTADEAKNGITPFYRENGGSMGETVYLERSETEASGPVRYVQSYPVLTQNHVVAFVPGKTAAEDQILYPTCLYSAVYKQDHIPSEKDGHDIAGPIPRNRIALLAVMYGPTTHKELVEDMASGKLALKPEEAARMWAARETYVTTDPDAVILSHRRGNQEIPNPEFRHV